MAGMLQMRRSRGAFSGFLLVLLGLWGALIPFIGPYFHYAYTPDVAWHLRHGPAVAGDPARRGGVPGRLPADGRHRPAHRAVRRAAGRGGRRLVRPGHHAQPAVEQPRDAGRLAGQLAAVFMRIMEQLGFFYALGVVIVLIAGVAIGRILSVPSGIRTAEPVDRDRPPSKRVPLRRRRPRAPG